mgnify:FL=1
MSLPAYKTIHSGKRSFCFTNNCGFPKEETLSEKLLRVHNWHQSKVAIISSWFNICYSAVRSLKNVLNSCGNKPLRLSDHDEININQTIDLPSWEGRKDKYTFQHAVKYIINHRPRFLHLALLDSDEWAHKNDWKNYIKSLKKYDLYIDQLFKLLENLGDYGNKTTVIITTDHGRGKGKKWTSHGKTWHARKIWMALKGPNIPHKGPIDHKYEVNHLHIRPIIELLLGVKDIYGKKRILKLFKDQLIQ